MSQRTIPAASGLTRRAFVGGALATGAALALAGCGKKDDGTKDAADKPADGAAADKPADEAATGPVTGGTFKFYINNPVSIDPYNVQEDQGMQVCKCLFDALTEYDFSQEKLVGKAATSWESNEDATQFTFHLREGATFHNGDPVTSASFEYGWNRLCNPQTDPSNPSAVSYHLSMVGGYADVQAGVEGAKLDVECPDDYTFVVNLSQGYADFPYVVSHLATSPIPEGGAADDTDTFKLAPVGNGAFQMEGEWADGQYIQVVRNDNYWGEKAYVDGIDFQILKDVDTAFTEFEGGNLDYAQIPRGRVNSCIEQYGESPDGATANPGEQTLTGPEISVYYLVCNNNDELLGNAHLRRAISHATNRQAICDTVFEGSTQPAANIVAPGVAGYEDGVWDACTYDVDKAKEELEAAKEELGVDEISITLSCNSDGDHQSIMQLIQADLDVIGVKAEIESTEWASYLTKLQDLDYQIGRLGWVADYPIMDNFLYPNFYTGVGDNRSGYTNPKFDEAVDAARAMVDDDERIAALQDANKILAEDFPVIPLLYYRHTIVTSSRVNEMYCNPMKLIDLSRCWLSA